MTASRLIRLKNFGSVRFTIVVLIVIVVASIVGTVIPQNWRDGQYITKYGHRFYRVLARLQLTDVYHSYWYTALLAVFCINLCLCSARSFGPLIKSLGQSSSTAGRVKLDDLPFHKGIHLRASAEDVRSQISEILARSLYRLKYAAPDSGVYYFERGKIGRLGPLITHASIVIIVIGGIFVGVFGFEERRRIPVGETVDVPHSGFQVRVDDFRVEFYPGLRTPREYTSVLTIIEDGIPRLTDTIEVNHPMKYKGIKFYQSSYGLADTVEIQLSKNVQDQPDGEVLGRFRLDVGESFDVPDSQLKIKPVVLVPDFVVDGSGQVGSRSREPRNPSVLLELYEGDELENRSWSFLQFPDFHGSGKSDYSMNLLSIGYYTELQISSDPALSVVWIGCLLMVVGLFLSFYLSYKRVWVKLSLDDGETILEMGGRSYKDRSGFEKEFSRLKDSLGQLDESSQN